ncbi:MAG: hypothetical protein JJU26_03075 [Oceanicaulis sp.]|uniref:hypothetical protein n=1 Tax=Glycocaulis sp. TaxID=1969725 RepID=UPI0025BA0702|nr:hypothetical protein [Glycocaulis sp.]MCC5980682.1 hypothetical protein [Oceanicaulis sp.]MCH8520853.1 hypothetical protein [Glycocaulis sp.]
MGLISFSAQAGAIEQPDQASAGFNDYASAFDDLDARLTLCPDVETRTVSYISPYIFPEDTQAIRSYGSTYRYCPSEQISDDPRVLHARFLASPQAAGKQDRYSRADNILSAMHTEERLTENFREVAIRMGRENLIPEIDNNIAPGHRRFGTLH